MNAVIIDISAYTILILFVLYTLFGFAGLMARDTRTSNDILRKQRFFLFATHLNCYVALLADNPSTFVAVLYVMELIFFFAVMKIYTFYYDDGSILLTNNMLMCLAIGFVILTRLDVDLALKQVMIAAVASIILLFAPIIVARATKFIRSFTWVYAGIGFFALLAVFMYGSLTGGAKLAITVAGTSFQPSEIVKILFVLFVAGFLSKGTDLKHVIIATVIAAAHVLLLVASTDLGAALIFFITYLVMLYIATKQWWWMILGLGAGAAASVVAYKLFYHVQVRVTAWLDPLSKVENEGYQISQALFAISGGGWFGEGIASGMPYKIPVVETDFIFAAIVEELGTVFAICLILVILTNFLMMVNISTKVKLPFYQYIAMGLGTCYTFQAFLNIGGVTKFIPCTGVTLPLISYGGTSLVATLIIFSFIQGMYVLENRQKKAIQNEKKREKRRQSRTSSKRRRS